MKKIIILFLCIVHNSYALIDWETTQITQKVDPLTDSVSATFRFKNIGDKVVVIKDIKASCGCTTAALVKKSYEPGESGEIVAKFDIGNRQGLQSKTITISTDNDEDAPTVLTMKTLIPKILEIQPAFVFWQKGEAPDVKIINLKVGIDSPMRIVAAQSDNSNVNVQLEEVEAGKHYRLTLFPVSTDDLIRARISLSTDFPKDKPKTFYVFAHVK